MNVGKDSGPLPDQATLIGGKGADGNFHFASFDNTGAQNVNATSTPLTGTRANSSAYEASRILKASAGTLISLLVYNSKASTQFIQLFDSATVPADATAPVALFEVGASSARSFDVPVTGIPFATGISVSNSSTGPTKTIGSADCYFAAVVR